MVQILLADPKTTELLCLQTMVLNWTTTNNGLFNYSILSLATKSGYSYAGTNGGGVFYFERQMEIVGSQEMMTLHNLPSNSLLLADTNLFAGTSDGVYQSYTHGQSWVPQNSGMGNLQVSCMIYTGNITFAGTLNDGIYASANFGTNWVPVNNNLTNLSVNVMTFDGINTYAGTSGGVFLTQVNGSTWNPVNNGFSTTSIYAMTACGGYVFAGTNLGVYVTSDTGTNWTLMNTGLLSNYITTMTSTNGIVFLGTYSTGTYYSNDFGQTWIPFNQGWSPNMNIQSLAT
jgi:hypothetical protein